MPSDPRVAMALDALRQTTADFRAAAQGALVQAESLLAAESSTVEARAERAARELGRFAVGRVSPERFAALFSRVTSLDDDSREALERAVAILHAVTIRAESLFVAEVAPDQPLEVAIDEALAVAGCAFGAIVVSELARGGRYRPAEHDRLLDGAEFRAWNRAERRFAPPLVVKLAGADLHAGALIDFADGREKLVLVVTGEMPPAALVRCVTPGTLVLQTTDGTGLDLLAGFEGPAIAALVPEGAAVFLHDPRKGAEPWRRLTVKHLPEAPRKAIGGASAWQMGEDLKMLQDLARPPFTPEQPRGADAISLA